ncbi:hypothetical protein, partial [Klebsiella pneumoniae]
MNGGVQTGKRMDIKQLKYLIALD